MLLFTHVLLMAPTWGHHQLISRVTFKTDHIQTIVKYLLFLWRIGVKRLLNYSSKWINLQKTVVVFRRSVCFGNHLTYNLILQKSVNHKFMINPTHYSTYPTLINSSLMDFEFTDYFYHFISVSNISFCVNMNSATIPFITELKLEKKTYAHFSSEP